MIDQTRRRFLMVIPAALLAAVGGGVLFRQKASASQSVLRVVKSPTCGCCTAWIDYMRSEGFSVSVENRDYFTDLKRENGVTADLESCHTAFIDGYVIEGHVPADLVRQLLAERPEGVRGIAVPGMPMGSPGMEGDHKDPYTVYTFDAAGRALPYAER